MISIANQIIFASIVVLNVIIIYGFLSKEKYFNKLHSINLANISPLRNNYFINLNIINILYIVFL